MTAMNFLYFPLVTSSREGISHLRQSSDAFIFQWILSSKGCNAVFVIEIIYCYTYILSMN
ncbi:hypothetical protein CPAR01_01768 [Colletotrichum paranaense]|uniref:Uncharacterized protein n=2 Tax=Colletotrichum acutatum species complex TaxID=2707335 RepID=A0AAI9XNS9_9PEZI|nr:uncharacterized protein CPAR01_01768 [Colletotrichum paranaense]KAK1454734.1 hypothetical protein CMEL01_03494 [Colletotrichum melonis]KAK1547801.1 hypothetical protein CPAR01_01768 [Colletotrichum paranaense]